MEACLGVNAAFGVVLIVKEGNKKMYTATERVTVK